MKRRALLETSTAIVIVIATVAIDLAFAFSTGARGLVSRAIQAQLLKHNRAIKQIVWGIMA